MNDIIVARLEDNHKNAVISKNNTSKSSIPVRKTTSTTKTNK
jgi:hypothetical protein